MRYFNVSIRTVDNGTFAIILNNEFSIAFVNMKTFEVEEKIMIDGETYNKGDDIPSNLNYINYYNDEYYFMISRNISSFVGFKGCIVSYGELYFVDKKLIHIFSMAKKFDQNTTIATVIDGHSIVLTGSPIQKITYDGECYEANNTLFNQYMANLTSKFKQIPELRKFDVIKQLEENTIPQHKIDAIERILKE